jgi:hypothetical protein
MNKRMAYTQSDLCGLVYVFLLISAFNMLSEAGLADRWILCVIHGLWPVLMGLCALLFFALKYDWEGQTTLISASSLVMAAGGLTFLYASTFVI